MFFCCFEIKEIIVFQPGYDKTDERWKKFLTRSRAWKVYRLQRTFICNEFQSKILDKMVTDYWKAQKW